MGETGAKFFKALVVGVDGWSERRIKRFRRLQEDVAKKISNVPEKDICESIPENVLVPAMLAYSYITDSEELRDMFANLIAKASTIPTQELIHPSFIEILKNLHPYESIIFSYIYKQNAAALINTTWNDKKNKLLYEPGKENIILMPADKPIKISFEGSENIIELKTWSVSDSVASPQYITNLSRLGLVKILNDRYITEREKDYATIISSDLIQEDKAKCEQRGQVFNIQKGMARITPFGTHFAKACIEPIPQEAVSVHIPG